MTGIVKTDQIQGAQGTTVTVPTGHTLTTDLTSASLSTTSSTATIAEFKKSGTTIGHIGVHDDDGFFFTRGATQQGIVLKNSSLMPCNTDGSNSDADQDLGISSVRWKDLYLSGGVRVGGTGSANYLDDYEEGTFTPTWNGYASPHATSGSYTKIGRQVVVYTELVTANVTDTSEVQIDNLPFTISGNRGGGIVWHNRTSLYGYDLLTVMNANTTGCKLNTVTASSNVVGVKYVDSGEPTLGGYTTLRWTIFYETS